MVMSKLYFIYSAIDFTFAKSASAKVPYATAGDCYSSKECPQVRIPAEM